MNIENNGRLSGRELAFYHHTSGEEYGYRKPQTDTFAVLHPKDEQPDKTYPLYVVFHSAGHDVYSAIGCTWANGNHDIYHAPEDMYALYLDCRANSGDWWWGGIDAHGSGDPSRAGTALQPVEKRCIDTVLWVIDHFPIEKNRVYAVGNSMGGSGALGIGLNHGDIFAAVIANVAAGVEHAVDRCMLGKPKPDGFSLPELPVTVDYSAQNDDWSEGHEKLYHGMKADKFALVGYWGIFGHENNLAKIRKVNDLVLCFDPLQVRLDEAYPAFTDASTDDEIPWADRKDTASGQVNAFFVWKNREDTADRFVMSLRLMRENEWHTSRSLPVESTVSVTLRRLQRFKLLPYEKVNVTYAGQSETVTASSSGLLTFQLTISQRDAELTVTKVV